MLAISASQIQPRKLIPNLLPCVIHHSGPVRVAKRHWDPAPCSSTKDQRKRRRIHNAAGDGNAENVDEKDKKDESSPENEGLTSYFRGRRLSGRTVRLPSGYEGMVLQRTERLLPQPPRTRQPAELAQGEEDDSESEMDETKLEVKVLEPEARFDEFVVWGHEQIVDDEDVYVRGVEEWIVFAEAMSSSEYC